LSWRCAFCYRCDEVFHVCFSKRDGRFPVAEIVTIPTPRGGLARMSRRVMNLAHLVTQNARRHGERVDVQTTEPVRLLALRGETRCEKAQTIAAKDSRLGHRQSLAECL